VRSVLAIMKDIHEEFSRAGQAVGLAVNRVEL
jgi:hypothetical protein